MKKLKLITLMLVLAVLVMGSGTSTLAQNDQNCALTPERILGQAFTSTAGAAFTSTAGAAFTSTAGADGEVAANGMTPDGDDIDGDDLGVDAEFIMTTLPYVNLNSMTATTDVALLVVDDFSSNPMEELEENEIASHGWLVYDVMETLLAELPANVRNRIDLYRVNIYGLYYSEEIEELISSTIESLNTDDGLTHFVVNMSFVFIPCRDSTTGFDFERFIENNDDDPAHSLLDELGADEDYVYNLLTDKRVKKVNTEQNRLDVDNNANSNKPGNPPGYQAVSVQFLKLLTDNKLQNDPLRTYFRDINRGNMIVIPVASAGNFKLDKPLFPARWREVLSVSATQGIESDAMWTHSNQGEVSAPGAWFTFSDEVQRAGTSFAAPVVSMLIAVDLVQGTPLCGIQGGGPKMGSGNFSNKPITEAGEGC